MAKAMGICNLLQINDSILETKECDICNIKFNDPVILGDKMSKSNITVHYYCLLLSTNLPQKGTDGTGILGFLLHDIKKEIKAAKKRSCMYCDKKGASIACNTCNKYFHISCGSARYCQHQFINEFHSYCHAHITIKHLKVHGLDKTCRICYLKMNEFNPVNSIMANCCGFGWVHSLCLKRYALTAGYYLKCLWCSSLLFREQVRYQGIFVPDRDAICELDNHNFSGLYENDCHCHAEKCVAPHCRDNKKGEKYNKNWNILLCNSCGSCGVHQLCYKEADQQYTCNSCLNVSNNTIIPNPIQSYRTVVNDHLELSMDHLEISTPFDLNNDKANKTLFMTKSNDNDILQVLDETLNDTNTATLKKLYKYNLSTQEVESVVLAYVDDTERNRYNVNEINILQEVNYNEAELSSDFIWECYREVLAEEEAEKHLNDGIDIYVDNADDDNKN